MKVLLDSFQLNGHRLGFNSEMPGSSLNSDKYNYI